MQDPVLQDPAAQSSPAGKKGVSPRSDRLIHPVAGTALLHSLEEETAKTEFPSDEGIEIHSGEQYVPPENGRIGKRDPECTAHLLDNLEGEKSDLCLAPGILAVIAVPLDSPSGMAENLRDTPHPVPETTESVTPLEIMAGRDPDIVEFDVHG
jgi:hypothetical protein